MEWMISSEDETYEMGKGMAKEKVEKKESDVMAQEALDDVIANISNLSSDKLRKIAALKLEDVQNSKQTFRKSYVVEKVKVKRGNTRTVNLKDMAEAIKEASSNNSASIQEMLKIFSDKVETELEARRLRALTPKQRLQDRSLDSIELEDYEPSSISRNSISESISRNSISSKKFDEVLDLDPEGLEVELKEELKPHEDKEVDDKLDRMIAKTIAARRHSAPAAFRNSPLTQVEQEPRPRSASMPSVANLKEQIAALEAKLAAIDKEPPPPSSKGSGSMSFTEVDSLKEAFGNWQKKRGSGESLVKLMAALKEEALDDFRLDKTLSEKSVELLEDLKKQANPMQQFRLGEIIKAVKGEEYDLGIADPDQEKAFKKVVGELEPPPPGFEDDTPTVAAGDASAKALDSVGSPPNFMPPPPEEDDMPPPEEGQAQRNLSPGQKDDQIGQMVKALDAKLKEIEPISLTRGENPQPLSQEVAQSHDKTLGELKVSLDNLEAEVKKFSKPINALNEILTKKIETLRASKKDLHTKISDGSLSEGAKETWDTAGRELKALNARGADDVDKLKATRERDAEILEILRGGDDDCRAAAEALEAIDADIASKERDLKTNKSLLESKSEGLNDIKQRYDTRQAAVDAVLRPNEVNIEEEFVLGGLPEVTADPVAVTFDAWRKTKTTSSEAFMDAVNTKAKAQAQAGEKPDHKVIAEKRKQILAKYRDDLPRFFGSPTKSDLDKTVKAQEGKQNAELLNSLFVGDFDKANAALEAGANTETLKLDGGKIERLKAELVNVGNKLADPSKKQSLFYHKDGGDHTSIRLEAVAGLEPKQRSFLSKYLDTVKNRGARAVVEEMLHNTKKAKAIIDYASGDPEISSVDPDLLASADLRSFSADPTFSLDSMGQSSPSGSRSMSVSSSISDEDPHRRSGAVVKNRSSMSSSVDSYMSQFRISDSGSPSFRASVSRGSVSDSVPRSPSGPESVAIPKNIRYAFAPTAVPVSESHSRSFADTMIQTHQGKGPVKGSERMSPSSGRRESDLRIIKER